MHDLVLLFKYKTGTVTSNFGRFIQTATRHYRIRNFHQANFDLPSRHDQEYYCNSYFPRTVKLWNSLILSLARISCGSESILTITSEVYYKIIVRHDLSINLYTFFSFFFLIYCVSQVYSNCCAASVASEQHYKQDLRKIYRRGDEFSNWSLFTRMHCI